MSEQEAQDKLPLRIHPDAPIPYAGDGPEYMVDYSSPLARAYDPEAFEYHPVESRSPIAAIQWSARRKLATDAADRVIASGLLGERARHVPVTDDIGNVLAMLDDLNESGGISYDDYSRLHDAVAALGGGE